DPATDRGLVLLAQCDIAGQCVDVACGVDPGARGRFCCDPLRCPFGCAPVTVLVAACPPLAGAASGLAHFRGAADDAARLGPLDRRFPCQPLGAAALVVACRAAREVPCVLAVLLDQQLPAFGVLAVSLHHALLRFASSSRNLCTSSSNTSTCTRHGSHCLSSPRLATLVGRPHFAHGPCVSRPCVSLRQPRIAMSRLTDSTWKP